MDDKPLPRYKCHKEVWALKIFAIHGNVIEPADAGYAPFVVSLDYMERHQPKAGGYFVVYEDGYASYSPAAAFESGYTRVGPTSSGAAGLAPYPRNWESITRSIIRNQVPTIGRMVHYVLNDEDAEKINRLRTDSGSIARRLEAIKEIDARISNSVVPMSEIMKGWPEGAQAHIGNRVEAGMEFPAMVVRDWSPKAGGTAHLETEHNFGINLQVFLDGNDVYWATSAHQAKSYAPREHGTWHWPELV